MEAFSPNLPDMHVDSVLGATTKPSAERQGERVIVVPDNHAVSNNRVYIHGVKEGDLGDINR